MKPRELALEIIRALRGAGQAGYLAGGCVRDMLLGREPKDYDVVSDALPNRVRDLFPDAIAVGAQFGVMLVRREEAQVEVATFRSDHAYLDGRRPSGVTFSGSASGGGVTSNTATSNTVMIQSPPSPPSLSIVPGTLTFTGELGLADPAPQLVQVTNSGGGTLAWSVTPSTTGGGNWLSVTPATGSAPPPVSVSVATRTCGLAVGSYNGSFVVSANGANGSPQSIPVALLVTQPTTPLPSPRARVCADRPAYRTGDTLRLSASLRRGAASNMGDVYVFARVPGTALFVSLVLLQDSFTPVVGPAPIPLARNLQAFDFAGELVRLTFVGTEPQGTYQVMGVLVPPGKDPLVPADALAVSTTEFAFTP